MSDETLRRAQDGRGLSVQETQELAAALVVEREAREFSEALERRAVARAEAAEQRLAAVLALVDEFDRFGMLDVTRLKNEIRAAVVSTPEPPRRIENAEILSVAIHTDGRGAPGTHWREVDPRAARGIPEDDPDV